MTLCFPAFTVALALLPLLFVRAAEAAEPDALRQKQQAQVQARALAEQLVSAVLDIQLRQLDENGLRSLPLYRDIAEMKDSIAGLVHREMDTIVELLIEAQEAAPSLREATLNAARAKIRDVAAQLIAERQRLQRRMNVVKLSADARQLIALQTKARDATQALLERRQQDRDRLALDIINDQADVTKLYYQLLVALNDVGDSSGPIAAAAADGARILRAAQVEIELKHASQSLASADFPPTIASQQNVLKGLAALLEKLDEAQGIFDSDREAALRLVRELIDRQRQLRERTSAAELTERTTEPLIEQQTRLHKELGKLPPAVAKFPQADALVEAAKAASFAATAGLFDEKKTAAMDQQGRVINSLIQIETILEQSLGLAHADKSSADLAADVVRLETLGKQLAKAAGEQLAANQAPLDQPQAAERHENKVATILAATEEMNLLPSTIIVRLDEVRETVAAAQRALHEPAPVERRHSAAEQALTVIRAAEAEVQSQLADARRWQKAVEVGELARAAEAIERAAAAETEIARLVAETAKTGQLTAEKVAALIVEQADISAVAERTSAGVAETAPDVTRMLNNAAPTIEDLGRTLQAADKPGNIAAAAKVTADQLVAAAAELRREQGRAAQQLEKIAAQQLAQAESARDAVQNVGQSPASTAEALTALQHARQKTEDAIIEQLRAAGRTAEATARSLTHHIAAIHNEQLSADAAAQALARGQANNPLLAATQQEQVAAHSTQAASQATASLARELQAASQSAGTAARETLTGSPLKAEQAREQTRAAIATASRLAEQLLKDAAQSQPIEFNSASQAKVAEIAGEERQSVVKIEKSIGDDARAAAESLRRAAEQAMTALARLQAGATSQVTASQQQALQALHESAEKLDAAIRQLAVQQSSQLQALTQKADQLADLARPIDPGAAAALWQAKKLAGGDPPISDHPDQLATAERQARQKIDQAAASLTARAQQIRRDRDLALALAQLAIDQQSARDTIAEAARALEQLPPTNADNATQLAAAQALQQAQQQFAAAQTATGEGAAEVSGQQEVANQPIREALEIASRLNQPALPKDAAAPVEQPDNSAQNTAQSKPEADSNSKSSNQLGTKMVPNSPQITAKQLAGQKANNAAAQMANALKGKGQPGKSEGESETPMEGAASSTAKKGGAAKGGKSTSNQQAKKGDLEKADPTDADSRGEPGGQDASLNGRSLESEAWFAKLPPSLRSAIQAKSRGKAPRGYEERLRRYFESID